jgi:hypothetical protein
VAARLRTLDPAAFEDLRARDAEIVRRFYSLDNGQPKTGQTLAACFGLSRNTIGLALRRGVARLLGWTAIDPNRRIHGVCTICGTPVARPAQRRSFACSAACMAELRRQATTSAAKRWGWPRADAVRALPPSALASLTEMERQLVVAYYGLDGEEAQTQRAVARRFKMDDKRAAALIAGAVERVLGAP